MCYKHRKEIKFPSFFLILWTCIVVAESSRLNSRKYLAKGQNPLCQELPLLTAKLDFWPRRSCLLLLKRSQPPKMFPSTRSCLGLYAHQVWASPPYFLEAMKRRLDSRLAMCMLLRKTWGDRNVSPCVLKLHAVFLMTWLSTFNTVDMLFLVCCDRAPWMCQYFTSSNQLLCKSEIDGVHRHSWHATWCLFWG